MKRDNSDKDSSSPRPWKRMRIDVALKTEVIVSARYRRRSDDERVWSERLKRVKP